MVLHCFEFFETGTCTKGKYQSEQNPNGTCPVKLHVRAKGLAEAERAIRQSAEPKDVKRVAAYDKRQSAAAAAIERDGAWTDDDEYWDGNQEELPEQATPGVQIEDLEPEDWVHDDGEYEGDDWEQH